MASTVCSLSRLAGSRVTRVRSGVAAAPGRADTAVQTRIERGARATVMSRTVSVSVLTRRDRSQQQQRAPREVFAGQTNRLHSRDDDVAPAAPLTMAAAAVHAANGDRSGDGAAIAWSDDATAHPSADPGHATATRPARATPAAAPDETALDVAAGTTAASVEASALRSDEAFKARYYWLWLCDRLVDVSVGHAKPLGGSRSRGDAVRQSARRFAFLVATVAYAATAIDSALSVADLRTKRKDGTHTPSEVQLEAASMIWLGAATWSGSMAALLLTWAWEPRWRPLRVRNALVALPLPVPPAQLASFNRTARIAIIAAHAWLVCVVGSGCVQYVAGFTADADARAFAAGMTAIPVLDPAVGHKWLAAELVVWVIVDPCIVYVCVATLMVSLVARSYVDVFGAARLSPGGLHRVVFGSGADVSDAGAIGGGGGGSGGGHAGQASGARAHLRKGSSTAVRDVVVRELLVPLAALCNGIGLAGHISIATGGLGIVFMIASIGDGGHAFFSTMGLVAFVPLLSLFLLWFASVNARVVVLRRRVSFMSVSDVLSAATHTGSGSVGLAVRAPGDAESKQGPLSADDATPAPSAVVQPTAGDAAARSTVKTALTELDTQLIAASPFAGVGVFGRRGTQVFTFTLAESFVGALVSLFVLVVSR